MKRSNVLETTIITLIAWAVGLMFLYAAAPKIKDPAEFAKAISYYKFLPIWAINGLALLLPWWELGAAVALFVPSWRRAGAAAVLGMVCMFIIAVSSAVIRGLDISCGCFGTGSQATGAKTLALDLLLLAACVLILKFDRPRESEPVLATEAVS
jgi:uncharacterized membrane protein YphA (DoxX/SURF4 family)